MSQLTGLRCSFACSFCFFDSSCFCIRCVVFTCVTMLETDFFIKLTALANKSCFVRKASTAALNVAWRGGVCGTIWLEEGFFYVISVQKFAAEGRGMSLKSLQVASDGHRGQAFDGIFKTRWSSLVETLASLSSHSAHNGAAKKKNTSRGTSGLMGQGGWETMEA